MRIQTIHTNAMGRVLNETNATGFRITDNQGRVAEVMVEAGIVVLRTPKGRLISLGVSDRTELTGKRPTGILVDEIVPIKDLMALTNSVAAHNQRLDKLPRAVLMDEDTVVCYGCNKSVYWLAHDGRCKECTHMTPDEAGGS